MFGNENIEYSLDLSSIEKIYSDSQDQLEKFYELISKGSKLFNLSENTFFEQSLFSKPKFSNLRLLFQSPYKVFFQKYNKLIEKTFEDEKLRKYSIDTLHMWGHLPINLQVYYLLFHLWS